MAITRILHGAGNVRELLPAAGHPAVDAIEADVWVRGEQLYAHHSRPLGPIPLVLGGNGLRPRPVEPVHLGELFEAVHERADLVIDLRSWFGDPAPDLVRELLGIPRRDHVYVSCESWPIADRVRAWLPDVRVGYSIRSERQLRRYLDDRRAGLLIETPVSVRHDLIRSPQEVEVLREQAGIVAVWTVDDIDRALDLVTWGVDAIVSNRLIVLNSI